MHAYFNAMLSESNSETQLTKEAVLERDETLSAPIFSRELSFAEQEKMQLQTEEEPPQEDEWQNLQLEPEFQVLFFSLSGLNFAVPLTDLGGIHALSDSMNKLFGKPAWFSGVMTHHEKLCNIVDTAQWMNTGESANTLNYSHYILLGNSEWGLSCENLLGTQTLNQSEIKWRARKGDRPWLAGMVKDKMCALIHTDELVKLLNNGMNMYGQ